jgi:sugar phosphate isomerase/epimerase
MISVSSPVFSLLDFEMALGFVSQEFDAWEIVAEGRHFLPELEKGFADATSPFDLKFSAHCPFSDINLGSLNPRMRDASVREVVNAISSSSRMNMSVCTVHPGYFSNIGMLDKQSVTAKTKESLKIIEAASKEYGVKVALENLPNMGGAGMGRTPEELYPLLEGLELGVCFDVGHANTNKVVDDWLRHTADFLNVHIHDNLGDYDAHLPIGLGNIDFKKVVAALSDYKGLMVIESRSLGEGVSSRDQLRTLVGSVR